MKTNELELLKDVITNATNNIKSDMQRVANAIEYIKLEASLNAFNEVLNYIDARQDIIAKQEQDIIAKQEQDKSTKKA